MHNYTRNLTSFCLVLEPDSGFRGRIHTKNVWNGMLGGMLRPEKEGVTRLYNQEVHKL
jgi:hypothetical protein